MTDDFHKKYARFKKELKVIQECRNSIENPDANFIMKTYQFQKTIVEPMEAAFRRLPKPKQDIVHASLFQSQGAGSNV